jgi:hypothetical protein
MISGMTHLVPGILDAGLIHGHDLIDIVLGEQVAVGIHFLRLALLRRLVGILRGQAIRQLQRRMMTLFISVGT